MTTRVKLDPQEQAAIGLLEARFSQRARFPVTLDLLISSWEGLVKEVEEGHTSSVDEYTNDLTTRDLLEEVLRSLPEGPRQKVASLVRPLDERFTAATCPDDEHVLSRFFEVPDGWWWSRIPARLAHESTAGQA